MNSKPLGSNGTYEVVEVTIYKSIKRNLAPICDDAYIVTGGTIGDTIDIQCDVGCGTSNPTVASTIVKCTSYSSLNNWAMGIVYKFHYNLKYINVLKLEGEAKIRVYLPIGVSDYELYWTGGNWKNVNSGGGDWEPRLKIDTRYRPSHDDVSSSIYNTSPSFFFSIINI